MSTKSPAPPAPWPGTDASTASHVVLFYESDAFLADSVARFIGEGLAAGDAAVVIATRSHHEHLAERLKARGLELTAAREEGRYIALEAAETLSKIMRAGRPDEKRFVRVVNGVLSRAAMKGRVRVFGEMVALLWKEGKADEAIQLEGLWNELAREIPFLLLCAYPIGGLPRDVDIQPFLDAICREHSHVIPAESYSATASPDERARAITRLQQKATVLDAEVAARKRADQSSAEARALLASIVESCDDAIVGKTLDGIVTSWNRGAEHVFGYTADEMIGQSISRLMPPERPDDFLLILGAIRRGERVEHFETERVRKDGRRIQVSLTVSPIVDSAGRIIGASKIARDVTERRRADAEREELLGIAQRARAEAETANRAKDEFLAMLGHELRNPLSALRNAVVSARLDDNRRDRALVIAQRQTDQLARLVDDLLDVARITERRIVLRKERVYLADVVDRAVEASRSLIEKKRHTLTVGLPPDPLPVDGDPVRLEQIVANLLNNAGKYTESGGRIELTLELQGSEAVLRMRDNGIGIAPPMLTRVFELFAQGGRGLDRGEGGLGIGLTVVRNLVELHGGRVEARSEGLGKGSEFEVRLPTARTIANDAPPVAARGELRRQSCARVVVVEDNADAAESLLMLLELLGHRVRVFHDGLSALEAVRTDTPDVMLVDIGLPGMDGYEVARRARQEPGLGKAVLVALTGYGRDDDRNRAIAAGFDYHLAKPIDVGQLQLLIAELSLRTPGSEPLDAPLTAICGAVAGKGDRQFG
jgi:PAS domain S-box-containing protein